MTETQYLMRQLFDTSRPGILTGARAGILTELGSFSIGPYTFSTKSLKGNYRGALSPEVPKGKYRGAVNRRIKRTKGLVKGRFAAYAHRDGTTEISEEFAHDPDMLDYILLHEDGHHVGGDQGEAELYALEEAERSNRRAYEIAMKINAIRLRNMRRGDGDPEDNEIVMGLQGTPYWSGIERLAA